MNHEISGSGGGKSSAGGGGISEDPDTLSGVTRARYIDLIGEGPIGGLVNGEASIYLDGVPLRDLKGTPNYKPFKWTSTPGTADQLPIPGFSGTSSEVGVGVNLTVSAGTIVRTIADGDADAVRVNVSVTGLSLTGSTGKISTTTVEYIIRARRSGGTWVDLKTVTISGKTGARYPKSDEVLLTGFAGTGPFEVSVTRLTADSSSGLLVNGLHWDSFTVINYEQYAYPHSALLALELDARYFSQIPSRTYHVKGLLVRVPDNYDPVNRIYAGVWAGRGHWKLAYTNNPAWCYFDLITNRRYSLGRRISDDQVDVWELYTISKYCDEIVPTGGTANISDILSIGGVSSAGSVVIGAPLRIGSGEPRFTLNCVINSVDDAYRVLNQLSTAFRGMTYWGASGVAFTQDRPTPVSMLWNNANVVDGKFIYAGSSKASRHTAVSVSWNDPNEDFRQRFEYVEDREGIARYGVRSTDTVAFGCTSRSQARRVGLWMLYTERMETDLITFRAGLDSSQVRPGDTGEIMDSKRVGLRWGGRVSASTIGSITLDAAVTLAVGTYTLSIVAKDGVIVTRSVSISTAGVYTTLTLTVVLAAAPADMSMWVLSSTSVSPVTVRVINVRQLDSISYEFSVLRHNPTKFNAIDRGAKLAVPNYSALKRGALSVVTGLVAVESTYLLGPTQTSTTSLDISWDRQVETATRGYTILIVSNTGFVKSVPEQSQASYTLYQVEVGTYTISVRPVSILGETGSTPATVTVTVTGAGSRVLKDGKDGSTIFLTNEAHTLSASFGGVVDSYAGADSYLILGSGGVDETELWTYTKTDVNLTSYFPNLAPYNHVVVDGFTPTKLLIHAAEAAGSLTPTDSSLAHRTIVNPGTAVALTSSNAKFDRALPFDGTTQSYLEVQFDPEFDLKAQDFAIQMQVYVPALLGARQFIMGWWGPTTATTDHSWALLVGTDGKLNFDYASLTDVADYTLTSAASIPVGVVTEVGVGRKGNVLTLKVGTTLLTFPFDKTIRTIVGDIETPLPPSVTLVSGPYPIDVVESMNVSHGFVRGSSFGVFEENMDVSHAFVSGSLVNVLQIYSLGPDENMDVSHAFVSGTLTTVLQTYSLGPAENMDVSHAFVSGTLTNVLLTYNNFADESMDVSHAFISGVLT